MTDHHPTPSVCPLCAVGCRLVPGEEGRARGAAGPANPNGRLCRKGVDAYQLGGDDRLTEPQVRRDSDLTVVAWETAYERIVEGIQDVIETHGPNALAFLGAPHCSNEESYLLQKLARTLGTNNVDNRARLCHSSSARALSEQVGWPATTGSLDALNDADVLVVAGANPAERQPIAFNSFVRPAVTHGTTLVHVAPVGNRTTRLADHHVAPRPGTDALVFDLLSAALIEDGNVDHEFIRERTRGYDAFAASLAGMDRDRVMARAGVDPETIRQLVGRLTGADRVAALVGTGIEGDVDDPNAAEALIDLLLLTGNVGHRGTGLYVLRGLVNEQGATDAGCVPDRLPGHQPVTDGTARTRVAEVWGIEPPAAPGMNASELLAAFGEEIRGAVIVGENPAISKRDSAWIRRRLAALDLLVVLDISPSETTRHADVVLPVAAGVETEGTFTNLERRIQLSRPTREPPETVRADFDVLREVGCRLFTDRDWFDYTDVGEVFDELTRVAPTHEGITYDDIGPEGRQWPGETDSTLYTESFDTPDGRAAFGRAQYDTETGDSTVDPETEGQLRLVTGGRASEWPADRTASDHPLRMHPADASDRRVASTDEVVVSNGSVAIETTVEITDRIRQGTVSLPAGVADPLLRCEASTVRIRPPSEYQETDP
ncbi:molybdopterin oxidoreductase family protein [Halohasta salina]|uniref:molybdopterin oxidoreductase family protein n=1 Tax=Halohasta salina TaxID=2961621 RepID=UPI0020A55B66|nr:molybdopterin-dependent oxidoreductase [Halohasta salina]